LIGQVNVSWVTTFALVSAEWWTGGRTTGVLSDYALGFWTNVLLAILVFEFMGYMFHRAMHAFPWLWRIHLVHHNDTELDFSTTYRSHPLDLVILAPLTVPVVLYLGFPAAALVVYQLLRTTITVFAHSNIYIPEPVDRVLRYIIVTPDFHRLHHSSDRRFTDSNYSAAFPIYDYLFGTATDKPFAEHETMEIGLEYFRDPADSRIDRLLLMPFRRLESGGARAPATPSVEPPRPGVDSVS
jgi:sterol desaturase/sphingolipid hydroxylase (fatty acid hydroxylase superfamily)